MILWVGAEQPIWAARVKRLKVGSQALLDPTVRSLVAKLRAILAPQHVTRSREIATPMTKPTATELLEGTARLKRFG